MAHRLIARALVAALICGVLLVPPPHPWPGPKSATLQAAPPEIDLPRGFVQETVVEGLDRPTAFAFAPDGRIFIAEHAGRIRVVHQGVLQAEPFVDIRDHVNTAVQRGAMGIAVHPGWPAVPYVYLAYTYEPPEAQGYPLEGARVSRVSRFRADPANLNRAQPGSETVILGTNSTFAHIGDPSRMNHKPYSCQNPDGSYVQDCVANEGNSHTLAQLAFGPDGMLYVGSGDGINYSAGNLRAQSVDSLNGKILRIHPITGAGLPDNPFYNGDPQANRSKVYALGFRYPFRFAFRPGTREIFVGDVGRDRWEEINRVVPGGNYGWPCYDGPELNATDPECQPLLSGRTGPVRQALYAYPHGEGRGAVIAGDFVRGGGFPAPYRNTYFYADFNSATIDFLTFEGRDAQGQEQVLSHVFSAPAMTAVQLTFGPDGALYVLYYGYGTLARIRYVGEGNRTPVAVAQATPVRGPAPLTVQFTGSNSSDPDGDRLELRWDLGDGTITGEHNPSHVYTKPGRYTVRLTVTDLLGASAQATLTVEVTGAGPAPEGQTTATSPSQPPPTPGPSEPEPLATPVSQPSSSPAPAPRPGEGPPQGWWETVPAPPDGARILLLAPPHREGAWSVVQWQDGDGRWHDVEGWRGEIQGGRKRWWVHPSLYGKGPFRWQIYSRPGGSLVVQSPPFTLPERREQMRVWHAP